MIVQIGNRLATVIHRSFDFLDRQIGNQLDMPDSCRQHKPQLSMLNLFVALHRSDQRVFVEIR